MPCCRKKMIVTPDTFELSPYQMISLHETKFYGRLALPIYTKTEAIQYSWLIHFISRYHFLNYDNIGNCLNGSVPWAK